MIRPLLHWVGIDNSMHTTILHCLGEGNHDAACILVQKKVGENIYIE